MSRGINKAILVGRLGNDPDVRVTAGGSAITTISIATTESWKDRNTGQQQERTEWHRVVFFGRLAEIAGQYLKKGSQVYVEGSLRTNKYTDKNGIERYSTDINANELQMLGGGNYNPNNPDGRHVDDLSMNNPRAKDPVREQLEREHGNGRNQQTGSNADFDTFDDDVPF